MPSCEKCGTKTNRYCIETHGYMCGDCHDDFTDWTPGPGEYYRDFLNVA